MKNLALWVDPPYRKDALFDPDTPLNRDDCLSSYRLLRKKLAALGWETHTQDHYRERGITPDSVLFTDMPPGGDPDVLLGTWAGRVRKLAVLLECRVIKPENWKPHAHEAFDVIFTWDESYVDGRKYFKVNFSNPFPSSTLRFSDGRDLFCVLIAANKRSSHPLELYSERENTLRWFERNHPGEFELYGIGWDRRVFGGSFPFRVLNRFPAVAKLFASSYPSYRGAVKSKRPVMAKSRFSICYENAREIPGYITEKIFDCFFSGTIPVYWGAPDISKYVPTECFIDRRSFADHESMYEFMKGLSDRDRECYQAAAAAYIASPAAYQFSDVYFAETVSAVVSRG